MKRRLLDKRKHKAVQYLLAHPDATAYQVAKHSGLSWGASSKLIADRQTPVGVFVDRGNKLIAEHATDWMVVPPTTPAGVSLLNEALDTFEKRGKTYGDAAQHWADVAALWTILTGHAVTPQQAVSMMIGLKQLRLKTTPGHWDTIVDIAGYSAVMANVIAANGG